ncbi:MAG: hypothetical protein ACJ8FS_04590 [Sphingomicrobium sp.]
MTGRTSLLFAALTLTATAASAAPGQTGSGQSGATASTVQRTSAFVCPVISTDNVLNSVKGSTLSQGDYTISGPTLQNGVPIGATNGDGTGSPQGSHSSPGDTDYSAIWSTC